MVRVERDIAFAMSKARETDLINVSITWYDEICKRRASNEHQAVMARDRSARVETSKELVSRRAVGRAFRGKGFIDLCLS